jgi:hypothetical protein
MAEISHIASSPPTKGLEYLSFSDRNAYLYCCIVAFSALLLFLHCCYSTCLPISFVHLHVPVASRWTKTVIPNLMLHCTKCILRARRICHCPSGSDSSGVAAATADAEEAVVAASGKLATVLIEVFALILKE